MPACERDFVGLLARFYLRTGRRGAERVDVVRRVVVVTAPGGQSGAMWVKVGETPIDPQGAAGSH